MRSLRDAVTLYRTLVGETLECFGYSEKGEALGRRLDNLACDWGYKIRPKPATTGEPLGEGWQDLGWIDGDAGVAISAFMDDISGPISEILAAHFDKVMGPAPTPPPEWLQIPKADLARYATVDNVTRGHQPLADSLHGIPLHLDPANEDMLRIRLEDINNHPSKAAVQQMLEAFENYAIPHRFMAGMTSGDFLREMESPMIEHVKNIQQAFDLSLQSAAASLSDLDGNVVRITPNDESKDTPHDDDPDAR